MFDFKGRWYKIDKNSYLNNIQIKNSRVNYDEYHIASLRNEYKSSPRPHHVKIMAKCRADSEIVLSSEPQDQVSGNIRILVCCYKDFVILKGELRATLKMKSFYTTSQPMYTTFGIKHC